MNNKGSFIVIDGTDGSFKGTQSEILLNRLRAEGKNAILTDFPRYGNPSAVFVEKYLRGEYGSADDVGAMRASIFYALDRYDASAEMRTWLADGNIIVSNRYVSANMGHQAGKIANKAERAKFLTWLKELEFGIFGIPVPDVNILLYMPPEIGQKLVDQKAERAYTKGKKRDIHEADLAHLTNASNAYLEVAASENWKVIRCVERDNTTVRTRESISDELYAYLLSEGAI